VLLGRNEYNLQQRSRRPFAVPRQPFYVSPAVRNDLQVALPVKELHAFHETVRSHNSGMFCTWATWIQSITSQTSFKICLHTGPLSPALRSDLVFSFSATLCTISLSTNASWVLRLSHPPWLYHTSDILYVWKSVLWKLLIRVDFKNRSTYCI
jgi:hypothetical protein